MAEPPLNVRDMHILGIGDGGNGLPGVQHLDEIGVGCCEDRCLPQWNVDRCALRQSASRACRIGVADKNIGMQRASGFPWIGQRHDGIMVVALHPYVFGITECRVGIAGRRIASCVAACRQE